MRTIASAFVIAAVAAIALQHTLGAQNFARRVPTSADWAALAKLPDFTGVWEIPMGGGGARGTGARGAATGRGRPTGPLLTPAYEAKRRVNLARAAEDSQTANCLPPGMPGIMGQPYPMEFLLTPGQVTIVIEAYQQVRHIYTDGRPLPEDPDLKFHGTSVGRWEADTLVVETVGFSPQTELDRGTPHGDTMKILERFRLTDADTMSIDTTITDPEALQTPFMSTRTLKRHRNWTIAEYICEENNRNSVSDSGKAGINLQLPVKKD